MTVDSYVQIDNGQLLGGPTLVISVRPLKDVGNAPGKLQKDLPQRGRGTARRRWMRGGAALYVVETMGAEVEPIVHVIPSERSESRNLPK